MSSTSSPSALATASRLAFIGASRSMTSAAAGPDRDLVHVDARAGVEHGAPLGDARSPRSRCCDPSDVSVVPSIGSTAMSHAGAAGADLLAVEQHGRFVLLALADHDDAVHRHGVEDDAHRVDRRAVGAVLVALAQPAPGGQRRRLGDPRRAPSPGCGRELGSAIPSQKATRMGTAAERVRNSSVNGRIPPRGGPRRGRFHARRRGPGAPRRRPRRRGHRSAARDRDVLREVRDLPRRRGARGGQRPLHRRPPPRVGGEPGRVGAPRRAPGRPRTGRMDTLPFFRRTIEDAGPRGRGGRGHRRVADRRRALGDAARARVHRRRPRARRRAWPTTRVGRATSRPAACSRSTTCSTTRPTAARRPIQVWQRAVADGFTPVSTTGSLRVLRAAASDRATC